MLTAPDVKYARDGTEILFVRRWNTLVSSLIVLPSVKLVARTVVDYGLADGGEIYPGNERIARQTGLTARAVQDAWAALRALGMAERIAPSYYDGRKRLADEYELAIPADWRLYAVYGPNLKRFTCQQCGKVFNPRPCLNVRKDGKTGWYLTQAVFCPPPRRGTSCFQLWERDRKAAKEPLWSALQDDAWKMFRLARGDDWPSAAEVQAHNERWGDPPKAAPKRDVFSDMADEDRAAGKPGYS